MERQVALAEATVAAVAGRADVAFDLHWRYAPADALRLARALEHLPLLWLEDPTPPQDLESIAEISARTTTPICTGENLYRLEGFAALMDHGGVDILAPDIQKVGGLSDTRRIAAYADIKSRPLAPHNIAGPIGTLASAHVCASIPNFLALEWHAASVPFFDELVTLDRPVIEGGYVTLPDGPGIGAELDVEVARRYARPGEPFFGELPPDGNRRSAALRLVNYRRPPDPRVGEDVELVGARGRELRDDCALRLLPGTSGACSAGSCVGHLGGARPRARP